jgi:hypothetical protein
MRTPELGYVRQQPTYRPSIWQAFRDTWKVWVVGLLIIGAIYAIGYFASVCLKHGAEAQAGQAATERGAYLR